MPLCAKRHNTKNTILAKHEEQFLIFARCQQGYNNPLGVILLAGVWRDRYSIPTITIIIFIVVIITITIIITRPKPAYGRQGLARSWSQDTYEVSTFLVFLTSQFNQPGTINDNENPPGNLEKPWKPAKTMKNHETTLKNHGNQAKTMKPPWKTMETNQKPWKTMKPPWKTMETNQKPWNYLEKPCKPSKIHETTLKNHGNQPKTMKNHETTSKNHGN